MLRMSAPLSRGEGASGSGPGPAAQPARIKRTNAAASQLVRLIASHRLDQARVIVLDVADARAHRAASCSFTGSPHRLIRSPHRRGRRYGEAERLGGLEINDKLEFGRLLDRKVAGLVASQDLVDIGRSDMAPVIGNIGSIGEKPTLVYILPLG